MSTRTPWNPRGLSKLSWNYRVLQLRHALGWRQWKLAKVMGVSRWTITDLETGNVQRPSIETILKIKSLELAYADILNAYKKAPARMDRLKTQNSREKWDKNRGVNLLPIEFQRPDDLESLGKVSFDSSGLFWGRTTRRKMPQTGMPERKKEIIRRRNQSISRAMRAKVAAGWRPGNRKR
jgi:DNA-binding XRE family transcriptional regulator